MFKCMRPLIGLVILVGNTPQRSTSQDDAHPALADYVEQTIPPDSVGSVFRIECVALERQGLLVAFVI